MKKLLFSLSLLASLATFADDNAIDASAQIFGVLPVTANTKSVIVSVPWVASGYTDTAISVSNIIKTANLAVGDTVKVWNKDKNSFDVWTLAEKDGLKYWEGITTVTPSGMTKADGSDLTTVARGGALILTRNGSYTSGTSYTFYVYGQVVSTDAAVSVTIVKGTPETPAYTLIASPYASKAADLNSDAEWSGLTYGGINGDRIYIGDGSDSIGKFVYYNTASGNGWGARTTAAGWHKAESLSAGIGCWYVSRTNENVSLTWKKEFAD